MVNKGINSRKNIAKIRERDAFKIGSWFLALTTRTNDTYLTDPFEYE